MEQLYRWAKASELDLKIGWYENCGYTWRGEWFGGRSYFNGDSFSGFAGDVISKDTMYILEPVKEINQEDVLEELFDNAQTMHLQEFISNIKSKYLLIKR